MPTATAKKSAAFTAAAAAPAFDITKEVKQVWRDFPEAKDSVYFIDLGTHKLVYPGDEKTALRLREKFSDDEELLALTRQYKEDEKTSVFIPQRAGGGFVLVYTDKIEGNHWNTVFPSDQLLTFTFDHELAHAVIPFGTGALDVSESVADAFATIRHFQRYGTDTGAIEKVRDLRARIFVLGDAGEKDNYRRSHFTAPVVDAILQRKDEIDWNALDMKQTADLARRFALEYAPNAVMWEALNHTFADARAYMRGGREDQPRGMRELAKVLLETGAGAVLKWGTAAYRSYMADHGDDAVLKKDWAKIEKRLDLLDAKNDVLFGIKTKSAPKPGVIANNP